MKLWNLMKAQKKLKDGFKKQTNMKNIRLNTFETNSSSTHSFHVDESAEVLESISPDENGIITIHVDEGFGWEWKRITDLETKLKYCATEGSGISRDFLSKALMLHTGCKKVEYVNATCPYDSYIDHQSIENLKSITDEYKLLILLLNPNSCILTGNDNQATPFGFYDMDKNPTHYVKFYNKTSVLEFKSYSIDSKEDLIKFIIQLEYLSILDESGEITNNFVSSFEYSHCYKHKHSKIDFENGTISLIKRGLTEKAWDRYCEYKGADKKLLIEIEEANLKNDPKNQVIINFDIKEITNEEDKKWEF